MVAVMIDADKVDERPIARTVIEHKVGHEYAVLALESCLLS
jgi:hypothetical protein